MSPLLKIFLFFFTFLLCCCFLCSIITITTYYFFFFPGIYLTVTMGMTSLSIILTVFVLQIHHVGPHKKRVPSWMRTLVFDLLARLLCMSYATKSLRHHRGISFRSAGGQNKVAAKEAMASAKKAFTNSSVIVCGVGEETAEWSSSSKNLGLDATNIKNSKRFQYPLNTTYNTCTCSSRNAVPNRYVNQQQLQLQNQQHGQRLQQQQQQEQIDRFGNRIMGNGMLGNNQVENPNSNTTANMETNNATTPGMNTNINPDPASSTHPGISNNKNDDNEQVEDQQTRNSTTTTLTTPPASSLATTSTAIATTTTSGDRPKLISSLSRQHLNANPSTKKNNPFVLFKNRQQHYLGNTSKSKSGNGDKLVRFDNKKIHQAITETCTICAPSVTQNLVPCHTSPQQGEHHHDHHHDHQQQHHHYSHNILSTPPRTTTSLTTTTTVATTTTMPLYNSSTSSIILEKEISEIHPRSLWGRHNNRKTNNSCSNKSHSHDKVSICNIKNQYHYSSHLHQQQQQHQHPTSSMTSSSSWRRSHGQWRDGDQLVEIETEWQMMALVMDRALFWLFLFVATVASIVILVIRPLLLKPEV